MKPKSYMVQVQPQKMSAARIYCQTAGHVYFKGQCITCLKPMELKEEKTGEAQ